MPDRFRLALVSLGLLIASGVCAQTEPMSVTIKTLSEVSIDTAGRASATVVARNNTLLAAEITGVIEAVAVDVGDHVGAGTILVQIDARDQQLVLDQAKANLAALDARIEQARKRLTRAQDLSTQNFTSADELLARETDLKVLSADRRGQEVTLARAARDVAKTTLRAPFEGTVVEKHAQLGAYVRPRLALGVTG